MSSAVPDIVEETLETDVGVHLVFTVSRDWEKEREAAIAEMERKVAACEAYGRSREFRERYGARPALVRMRSTYAVPQVVLDVMRASGVDVEVVHRLRVAPGFACAICARAGLAEDEVAMTARGWACGACFRGWSLAVDAPLRDDSDGGRGRRRRAALVAVVALVLLCAVGLVVWRAG